jgi:hypothetical protein
MSIFVYLMYQQAFCNPILFTISTNTFRKLCKVVIIAIMRALKYENEDIGILLIKIRTNVRNLLIPIPILVSDISNNPASESMT